MLEDWVWKKKIPEDLQLASPHPYSDQTDPVFPRHAYWSWSLVCISLVEESEEQTYFDLEYVFAVYQKK